MLGVTFGNKHSYNDWGIWLEDMHINPPLPKRYIVDVPARNGLLDLTPELTPTIRFENRTLTFNFRVKAGDWSTLVSQIYGDIHGQTLDVVSDLDPNWHWHGCVTVDDFSSDQRTGKLVITVDADPFKLSNTENSYTVNGNGTITCVVDRMEISPAFELTAPTTVIYGDSSYVIESTATTEKTLSGDIVSFVDGTANPAVDLTADIEATQDLHGYDYPWVGGAGKNQFPLPTSAITQSGVTVEATSDGEIWVHGTPTISSGYIAFELPQVASSIVGQTVQFSVNEKTVGVGFTVGSGNGSLNLTLSDTATLKNGTYTDGTRIPYVNVRYDVGAINKKYKIQLEVGVTQTTFEPYSNICPITGWTGAKVFRIGKNWCNEDGDLALGFWVTSNGVPSITANTSNIAFNYKIPIPKGEPLTLSANTSINNFGYCTFQADGTYINRVNNNNTSSVTIASTTFDRYALVWVNRNNTAFSSLNSAREWLLSAEIQIEYGTERSTYINDSATYSVTWTDAGTVYGGSLDVTTGVLTLTHGYVTLDGTTNWGMGTAAAFRYFDASMSALNASSWETNVLSNMFNQQGTYPYVQIGGAKKIRVCYSINDTSVTTVAQLQALLTQNALQVLYPLATPQTVQLTPTQVTTLLGQNNIWADSGEVEVTYLAQDFAGKTFYIPDLELTEGSHELTIQGTGTTKVTYTNGRL